MFPTEEKLLEKYVKGLVPQIRSNVNSASLTSLSKAIRLSAKLTDEAVLDGTLTKKGAPVSSYASNPTATHSSNRSDRKRKWQERCKQKASTEQSHATTPPVKQ